MYCSSYNDCNDHGDCIDNSCLCDLGWFGDDCTESFKEEWSSAWNAFIIVFTIANSLLLFLSLIKLYLLIKPESYLGFRRLSRRIISSPKNLSLCCIAIISLLKILWLLIDPLRFQNKASRFTDRFLFETVYPLYFCLYSTVVLVIAGLYQGIRKEPTYQFKIIRTCFLVFIVLCYIVTWGVAILKGIRFGEPWIYSVGFTFIGIAAGLQGFCFLVLIVLVCNTIQTENTQSKRKSNLESETGSMTAREENIHKEELNKLINIKASKYILLISKEDRNVLKKIIILTTLNTLLGIITFLLFTIFADYKNSDNPEILLVGLYLVSFLEIVGCIVIFVVFTTQIQTHSKENLMEFTKIALKKKHVFSVIQDKENRFANIGSRLEKYFSN